MRRECPKDQMHFQAVELVYAFPAFTDDHLISLVRCDTALAVVRPGSKLHVFPDDITRCMVSMRSCNELPT